jgi:hypothetical protein
MNPSNRVFFDRKGRRSFWTNVALAFGGLLTLAGTGCLLFGIVFAPVLPSLKIPARWEWGEDATNTISPSLRSAGEPSLKLGRVKASFHDRAKTLRFGVVSPYDVGSLLSLRDHAKDLDAVIFDSLVLAEASAGVDLADKFEDPPHLAWLAQSAPGVSVFPSISIAVPKPHRQSVSSPDFRISATPSRSPLSA